MFDRLELWPSLHSNILKCVDRFGLTRCRQHKRSFCLWPHQNAQKMCRLSSSHWHIFSVHCSLSESMTIAMRLTLINPLPIFRLNSRQAAFTKWLLASATLYKSFKLKCAKISPKHSPVNSNTFGGRSSFCEWRFAVERFKIRFTHLMRFFIFLEKTSFKEKPRGLWTFANVPYFHLDLH